MTESPASSPMIPLPLPSTIVDEIVPDAVFVVWVPSTVFVPSITVCTVAGIVTRPWDSRPRL